MSNTVQNPDGAVSRQSGPTQSERRSQAGTSDNGAWFSTITRPLLALVTVLITFFMFGYFVQIASGPVQEIQGLNTAQRNFDSAQGEMDAANSLLQKADPGKLDEKKKLEDEAAAKRKMRDEARAALSNAKATLEVSREQRTTAKELILYILGVLSSALTTILGYYFGSSKSSADKNSTINEIAKTSGRSRLARND